MIPIPDSEVPCSLDELAERVRRSSNFRFAWQWFRSEVDCIPSEESARQILDVCVEDPACHNFLRATYDPLYGSPFQIEAVHEHCVLKQADGEFERTIARAASDRLGAYSHTLSEAPEAKRNEIASLFSSPGRFVVFELLPGSEPSCPDCGKHNSHLFTNWFYGVAWDWCFVVIWPATQLIWIGCLTDTD